MITSMVNEMWQQEVSEHTQDVMLMLRYKKALQDICCIGVGNINKILIQAFNYEAIRIAKEALENDNL